MDKELKLRPCPVCNGTLNVGQVHCYSGRVVGFKVYCEKCSLVSRKYKTKREAVKEWSDSDGSQVSQ